MAALAAQHLLATLSLEQLPHAVLLLPTRRACHLMRIALMEALKGKTALLPRILPMGDLEAEIPALLPPERLPDLLAIPPAMAPWKRLGLLTAQVYNFELRRSGSMPFEYALKLAKDLARLQDEAARFDVTLDRATLAQLAVDERYSQHWEHTLQFLGIVGEVWPMIEAEEGALLAETRSARITRLLAESWRDAPPDYPVIAIGSTASQPATAELLEAVAQLPQGSLMLPGLDPRISDAEWQAIAWGHPYAHLKALLDRLHVSPNALTLLGEFTPRSLWLDALAPHTQMADWRGLPALPSHDNIRLVPCAHGEEEARAVTLLIREALEQKGTRTALITPDEGLMEHVAQQLARYGITPGRMKQGTLAATAWGSLMRALLQVITDRQRSLPILSLLRHPLLLPTWEDWLTQSEPYFRGLYNADAGTLPSLPETLRQGRAYEHAQQLLHGLHTLERQRLRPSQWVAQLDALLRPFTLEGDGREAIRDALDALGATDMLGELDAHSFNALLEESFTASWRGGIHDTHPDIVMLTPLEARLQPLDRVILANMQDTLWPGLASGGSWLNLTQRQQLGLPQPEEQGSLMAHDLLLLGSAPEVILTYPKRDGGSPTTRSRYIERLLALLAVHGIEEEALVRTEIPLWANALYEAQHWQPATPPEPKPTIENRPKAVDVSALDYLSIDPFRLYARYVLQLKELKEIDAEPDAREYGTITHDALKQLTDHWNSLNREAGESELALMADAVLEPFAAHPEIGLFWRDKLMRGLCFVNAQEADRRRTRAEVSSEDRVSGQVALPHGILTLKGRIDRLEQGEGGLAIGDYKTGKVPSPTEILQGKALQLLAYALLFDTPASALEYWELPAARREGKVRGIEPETIPELLDKTQALLGQLMDPETALRARPVPDAQKDRYPTTYDGVSRYDEWAG
jgi:ATP-dependent helicase/nuclease subunit B